ncbi:MAG: twin-arginine translocation signal domain-containing protein [Acidobacteriia bacterium]|nr:twin-arginine translocation signal domain-containing protein [Terriglobia bacterium]
MARERSRREFLKTSGGGIAALAVTQTLPALPPAAEADETGPPPGDLAI